jgi:hypothetical protein
MIPPTVEPHKYRAAYSPAADKPNFLYQNDSGSFALHEARGQAIYTWIDGRAYDDALVYVGHSRLGQPDDDYNKIGFDSGFVYKVVNENWWFFFSSLRFQPPGHDHPLFRMYTS